MIRKTWLVVSLLALVVLAGCNFGGKEKVSIPPLEPGDVIFEDDFTDYEIGDTPSQWEYTDKFDEFGTVKVVVDDGVPSGRAAHFYVDAVDASPGHIVGMLSPKIGEEAKNAKRIGFEYWIKYEQGSAVYQYLSKGNTHYMILLPTDNKFQNRENYGGSNVWKYVADLEDGWNQIRIIADRDQKKAEFYVNDMENPIADDFQTLRLVEDWEDLRFRTVQEAGSNQVREAYYSGVKIWVVE